jgi:hypothetical protein
LFTSPSQTLSQKENMKSSQKLSNFAAEYGAETDPKFRG